MESGIAAEELHINDSLVTSLSGRPRGDGCHLEFPGSMASAARVFDVGRGRNSAGLDYSAQRASGVDADIGGDGNIGGMADFVGDDSFDSRRGAHDEYGDDWYAVADYCVNSFGRYSCGELLEARCCVRG